MGALSSVKENAQPNRGQQQRGRGALEPTVSVSANFKDGLYVDSCDAVELSPGRAPISEVKAPAGKKADPQHTSPLLENECVLAEYSTLAEFTFGLPRYHVIFTSHRVIMKQRRRFLGLVGKESEQFICYRDLVNVTIGSSGIARQLKVAAALTVLGLLLFALLRIADSDGAAWAFLVVFLGIAAVLILHNVLMDHFIEGVDLIIEACKVGKLVPSWSQRTNNQSAESFYVRLPPDQAFAAMKLILGHSEFGLLCSSVAV